MNITTYKSALPAFFKANITPLVYGFHGVGKSTAPQQYADEGGHILVNLRLGNLEAGDLLGIQDFECDADGIKIATKHFKPDWLRKLEDFAVANPDKYAILHLDEINHIRRDLQSFIWQICLDKRLHTYEFPANLVVIASANPPTKDYPGTLDFKNKALLSRFCHVALRPDLAETLGYFRNTLQADGVADFLQEQPQMLNGNLETFTVDAYAAPSPRSWDAFFRLQKAGAPSEALYGMVGTVAGNAYFEYMKNRQEAVIAPNDVLNSYNTTKSGVRKAIKKLVKEQKYAALKLLCEGIQNEVLSASKADPKFQYDKKTVGENLKDFSIDLPADLSYAFLLVVCGPEATAAMFVLDGFEELHKFVEEQQAKGQFKAAQ